VVGRVAPSRGAERGGGSGRVGPIWKREGGAWAVPGTRGPVEEKEKNEPGPKEQEGFRFIQINFN
jgi:hypothetical protein